MLFKKVGDKKHNLFFIFVELSVLVFFRNNFVKEHFYKDKSTFLNQRKICDFLMPNLTYSMTTKIHLKSGL
jgi:hypothetical protein